jgi:hypothetical protein
LRNECLDKVAAFRYLATVRHFAAIYHFAVIMGAASIPLAVYSTGTTR